MICSRDKSRLLIVDDVRANIKVLAEALRSEHEISLALDGKSALEVAEREHPDIILLDVMMPEMDGHEVCRRIKANEKTRDIVIIFVTAKDDALDETIGFELGAVDYITKPFSKPVVQARIRNHIELLKARQRLENQNRQLIEAACLREDVERNLSIMGGLAAGVAHEINTPIQYLGDNVKFIKDSFTSVMHIIDQYEKLRASCFTNGVFTDDVTKIGDLVEKYELSYLRQETPTAITQSLEGIEQVSRIVQSMKEFSHIGLSHKSPTDINRAIRNTEAISRSQWKEFAEMTLDLEEGLPPVSCCVSEINQVIMNLIINAAQAISAGAVNANFNSKQDRGKIMITTRSDCDHVEVRVSDTGPGIPTNIRARIFDPFFTTKEIGQGTGQGLAICLDIVTAKHNGRLFVEGEEGHGATFVVRLPTNGGSEALSG